MKKLIMSSLLGFLVATSAQAEDCIIAKELNVEFENDSTIYRDSKELEKIKEYASFIKETNLHTLVEGHTNSFAPASYNFDLSERRALKVRSELIHLGVPEDKVRAMGFGESSPLYSNSTKDGIVKNRRVIAEVFNSSEELKDYIVSEKNRISEIKYKEQ